jgi:hypothetical protein
MSRSAVRIVLAIFVALVLMVGAGGAIIWWKITNLKTALVGDIGKALGAQVQVASIDFDIWKGEIRAAGITLVNQRPSAPWDKGDISQATVKFYLSDLLAPTLPLTVDVSSWNVTLHSPLRTAEAPPSETSTSTSEPAPAHSRVQVTQIAADGGSVEVDFSDDRKVLVHGISFQAGNNGAGVWTTQLHATSISAGSLTTGASSVQILGEEDKVTFSDLKMQVDPGIVTGEGEVALGNDHEAKVSLKAVDVPVSMLVAVEWQMKLSGLATGTLTYNGSDKSGSAQGQVSINHGKFNVLPWLAKVTTLVGLQNISDMEVDKATTNFEWKDRMVHLTDIDVRKNDVTRIAGQVDIDDKNQVDGRIKLGLPSSVTAKWPQLQDKVFPVQLEDYNWTEVHLTGTPDNLQEDLTPRLLTASVGQGTDLLKQAAQKATDLLNSFMGTPASPQTTNPPPPPVQPPSPLPPASPH